MAEAPKDKSKLRTGFTTGACATAAAAGACEMLLSGEDRTEAIIHLPIGKRVRFALERHEKDANGSVTCSVIKDAGDDPDCTHGAHLTATVRVSRTPGIHISGGAGVGVITKPGIGLPVGAPAINPVPRQMIETALGELLARYPKVTGLDVVISVPGGEEMAKHTLNARLGIVGGISILGTTGIVRPYSTAAFKASVEQAIGIARNQGCKHIVLTTGGRSEKYARALLPDLPEAAFVQMGDFVGFALASAHQHGIERATLCGMIGKLSKLADGKKQTHAAGSEVNMALLAKLVKGLKAPKAVVDAVAQANTGRHAMEIAGTAGFPGLAGAVCQRAAGFAKKFAGGELAVEVILTDFEGVVLGRYPAS